MTEKTLVEPTRAIQGAAGILYVPSPVRERPMVRERLLRSGFPIVVAADVADALQLFGRKRIALCLIDLAEERGALGVTRVLRSQQPHLPIVGIVDPGNSIVAGEALRVGVADLLPFPFEDRELGALLVNARDRMVADVPVPGPTTERAHPIFAQSAAMRHAVEVARLAESNRAAVALVGEPGSGREVLGRAIHAASASPGAGPFLVVDCAREAPADLERRLFGVLAAGDAKQGQIERLGRTGAIVEAGGGTLFLVHLPEAPARVQARLARLLRDREASIDKQAVVQLDVRPMAAFEPDVDAAVADGRLRRELVERLMKLRVDVPPLRRRKEDIPLLAVHCLQAATPEGAMAKSLSRSALALLAALPWPGNGDDLRAFIETLVRSVRKPIIQLDDLLEHASLDGVSARMDAGVTLRDAKARFERDCITAVLMRHHGRVGEAAKALGIQRTNLYRKVRQLNVARSLLSARK
ncbi:MAG TPA: sigma 54-interacting transcriptional regulator [Vicinamibacterales bacterium]|nr:sigma 54-interacting transcriptional regulator [Vicinamibacterales bacterium]